MIFSSDLRLHGRHAELIKKYSKDKQADEQFNLTVKDNIGNTHNTYIFETMIQAYMVSALIGIISETKVENDTQSEPTANIFSQVLLKNKSSLERITQFMILSKNNNISADLKIRNAFTLNKDALLEKEVTAYSRYGMEIIDSYFNECITQEDIVNQLYSFMKDYSIDKF